MKLDNLHRDQPKAQKRNVIDFDEHLGQHPNRWHNTYAKDSKPYGWSKTGVFKGQSEAYDEHILN